MKNLFMYIILVFFFNSCGDDFLDIKRQSDQVVPQKIKDYHSIIARSDVMLNTSNSLNFVGSDEYSVENEAQLISGSKYEPFHKHAYIWADDGFEFNEQVADWNLAYERIAYANLALDVEKLKAESGLEQLQQLEVRLAARFYRAWNFYQLAQLFCKVYDPVTANQELGLPIRLDYDLSVNYGRSNLKALYEQILKDLDEAEVIGRQHSVDNRQNPYFPGLLSVYALASRIYLQIGDFQKAKDYADKVLEKMDDLIDYNKLVGNIVNENSSYFKRNGEGNSEIIFYTKGGESGILSSSRFRANEMLLQSFDINDLRKEKGFFKRTTGNTVFIGSFSGSTNFYFTGLSVAEMLLNRAEYYVRVGDEDSALRDLNKLRANRYKDYKPLFKIDVEDVMGLILMERRKELYMRGMRWDDARRLNREGKYPVSFTRVLEGETFSLKPNSKKWIWPLPPNEIVHNKLIDNDR